MPDLLFMITKIALENIKSILSEQEIELTPFTLLIGDNGSGKSTYIQALSLLSQNSSPSLADGRIINQGGFEYLINDPQKPIKIKLEGNLKLENTDFPYLHSMKYYFEFYFDKTAQNNLN
ncbi:MAG: AAA family ATPase, partial [Nitrososphaeraceae archaeon]